MPMVDLFSFKMFGLWSFILQANMLKEALIKGSHFPLRQQFQISKVSTVKMPQLALALCLANRSVFLRTVFA